MTNILSILGEVRGAGSGVYRNFSNLRGSRLNLRFTILLREKPYAGQICDLRGGTGDFGAGLAGVLVRDEFGLDGVPALPARRARRFLRLIALNCAFLRLFQIYIFFGKTNCMSREVEKERSRAKRSGKIYRLLPLITPFCRVFGGYGRGCVNCRFTIYDFGLKRERCGRGGVSAIFAGRSCVCGQKSVFSRNSVHLKSDKSAYVF
jgi:hypothetical protein